MSEPKFFVWDVESTGIDVFNDRIVQLFAATADENGDLIDTWEFFIDPGIEIPEEASAVHGFTNEFLAEHGEKPEDAFNTLWHLFSRHRNLIQVAFNMNYDLSILDAEMKRHGISESFGSWFAENGRLVDGIVIDRYKDKYRKGKRTLAAQADYYGVSYDPDELHNARADVELTAKVTVAILNKYGTPTTAEQAEWREEWRKGFEEYLRRSDPSAVVEVGWPLRLKEG